MSIDVTLGSGILNVPLLNSGAVQGFLDTTLLGVETGSADGNIALLDTGAVSGKLDTTLLGVELTKTSITVTTGTTAGTITDYQKINIEGSTITDLLNVAGYENSGTTAQVLTFAKPYTTFNGIIANTTGLTLTLTLTTLTITAPDNTTLYNGIINIQGV